MSATDTYIVYETTNIVNGKYYIGVHKINDYFYLGSGKILKLAIKKYGRNNFIQEVLQSFSNEQDAYYYEQLIIDTDMINNPHCYNIVKGGGNPPTSYGKHHYQYNKPLPEETKIKISKSLTGNTHSYKTKNKMSISKKGNTNARSKLWYIDGKLFSSSYDAGKFFDVTHQTIMNWCSNNIPLCYCTGSKRNSRTISSIKQSSLS